MAKEIVWLQPAKNSFFNIINYLEHNWTEKEIRSFVSKTDKIIGIISSGKVKFKKSNKKSIYEILITKHNLLIYREKANKIELLLFYDTRQHPKKKKF
jgi:arsenate reductase-like glutaredoxin family protein